MAYGTLDEFTRRLGLTSPSPAASAQAQQALDAAALEIDWFLGWRSGAPLLSAQEQALVEGVNYDRAAEHWRNPAYGALNQAADLAPVMTARNSWYRHGVKLLPLKAEFGVG